LAALVGRRDLVNILVRYGASTGAQTDVTCSTPVHIASQCGYLGAVEQLLTDVLPSGESDTLHHLVNMDGWTALHMAADRGHLDIVKQLVEHSRKGNSMVLNCGIHTFF
jgi:ankyrin repeat protein